MCYRRSEVDLVKLTQPRTSQPKPHVNPNWTNPTRHSWIEWSLIPKRISNITYRNCTRHDNRNKATRFSPNPTQTWTERPFARHWKQTRLNQLLTYVARRRGRTPKWGQEMTTLKILKLDLGIETSPSYIAWRRGRVLKWEWRLRRKMTSSWNLNVNLGAKTSLSTQLETFRGRETSSVRSFRAS